MVKYQWNSEKLRKRANFFNGMTLVAGVMALLTYFVGFGNGTTTMLIVWLVILLACQLMWWRILSRDKKLKPKE